MIADAHDGDTLIDGEVDQGPEREPTQEAPYFRFAPFPDAGHGSQGLCDLPTLNNCLPTVLPTESACGVGNHPHPCLTLGKWFRGKVDVVDQR